MTLTNAVKSTDSEKAPPTDAKKSLLSGVKQQMRQAFGMGQSGQGAQNAGAANGLASGPATQPDAMYLNPETKPFDKKQRAKIVSAMKAAMTMANKAEPRVAATGKLFQTWFDGTNTAETAGRAVKVREVYVKVKEALKTEQIYFEKYALKDGEEDTTFAYVKQSEAQHNIYLGNAFWKAATKGDDSKGGTIIHELTHRVAKTKDHEYGHEGAKTLAKSSPDKAIENADNYEYFAEKA